MSEPGKDGRQNSRMDRLQAGVISRDERRLRGELLHLVAVYRDVIQAGWGGNDNLVPLGAAPTNNVRHIRYN